MFFIHKSISDLLHFLLMGKMLSYFLVSVVFFKLSDLEGHLSLQNFVSLLKIEALVAIFHLLILCIAPI